ncbi:unnamed protein product [Anisakis simplex]|uniref:Uncharacterized protein n=1 Tax=Anisakis simplex TaxID=6269 RepID=A0A0M3JLD9_ANISI|nr:unnamed protein product [Anisakis simplex]
MNGSSHYPYGHHAHQITTQVVIESSSHRTDDVSVDDDDEEVDVERCDFDSDGPPQLLDLSCRFVFR